MTPAVRPCYGAAPLLCGGALLVGCIPPGTVCHTTGIRVGDATPSLSTHTPNRVMKNFGITDLWVVNSRCDILADDAQKMSCHALDVLQAAHKVAGGVGSVAVRFEIRF